MTDPLLARLQGVLAERYAIAGELGRGGMAMVYLADDLKHERRVAIKVLRPELAAALGPDRFLREIRLTAKLNHPHILPLLDSGEASGLLYYVMPYVEGESLRARLQREGQLPLDDALQIAREVADALAHAHAHGIVHRDVKPENTLLSGGHAVVADFGIARAIEGAAGSGGVGTIVTQTGITMGTPAYMSPEQASGDTKLDGRSDIYSLACVVYEMLGGEPPHTGPTPQAILARQLTGEVRSLVPLRSSVSRGLDAVIRRGLAPAPADRYRTASQFADALGAAAARRRSLAGLRLRLGRRPRWAVAGAILLVAGAAWWMVNQWRQPGEGDALLRVAIFPFRPAGAQAQEWSEALPDFLTTALDGTPELLVTDPWALWRSLRPARGERALSPDADEARRLAQRAGATRFVLGSVAQQGGRLELSLRIYSASVADPLASVAAAGSLDSISALVQRLAVEVIARVWPRGALPSVPQLDRYATHSAEGLKAYLRAKEAMRRGRVDSANVAIDRALALDSTFALALVEAVRIKTWAQFLRGEQYSGLMELAERAVQHGDSLSLRNQLRARSMLALVRTDGVAAAEALGRILQIDSTDIEAWQALSYSHLAYGWQYGKGEREALSAAERAVRLDSTDATALVTLAALAEATEDRDAMMRALDGLRRTDTTLSLVRGASARLGALLVSDAQSEALLDSVARRPPAEWIAVLRGLRSYRPDRAERLLAGARAAAGPGLPTRTAVGAGVQFAIAAGRLRQTDSALRAGRYEEPPGFARTVDRFLLGSAIAGVSDSAVARRAAQALAAYIPLDSALAYFRTRPVWWTGWVLAAYHATLGDSVTARRWWRVFGTLPPGGTSQDYRGALQRDIDARLAARRGDLTAALGHARQAYDWWTIHTDNQLEALPEPAMRFHLASLLAATGRPDSSAALYRSLVPPTTWMGVYTARASLALGQLAEMEGDRATAARYYERALALWKRGGDEVAPWRNQAEGGLRRMVGEPPR